MRHLISVFDLCFYIGIKSLERETLLETLSFTRSFLVGSSEWFETAVYTRLRWFWSIDSKGDIHVLSFASCHWSWFLENYIPMIRLDGIIAFSSSIIWESLVLFFSSKLSLGSAVVIFTNKDSNFHLCSYSSDMDETSHFCQLSNRNRRSYALTDPRHCRRCAVGRQLLMLGGWMDGQR